jgi:hypothetical protein
VNPALIAISATLIGVSFASVIALMAWIVQTLSRVNATQERMAERSEDHERRLGDLEHIRVAAERERWRA